MNKAILSCCLLFFLGYSPLSAQKGFYGTLGGNINISYVAPQNTYGVNNAELDYVFESGYSGNIRLGYNWHEMLGIGLEASYLSGGQQYRDKIKLGPGQPRLQHDKLVRLNYITITPLFRVSPILEKNIYREERKFKFVMAVGPQVGILTGANVDYQIDGVDIPYPIQGIPGVPYSPQMDDKKLYEDISVNLLFDFGFDWYISEKFFMNTAVRGQFSLTDINAKEYRNHDQYDASHLFLGGLQVGFGYYFTQVRRQY